MKFTVNGLGNFQIRVLSHARLFLGLPSIDRKIQLTLFALLVLAHGEFATPDDLIETTYSKPAVGMKANAFRVMIYRLRELFSKAPPYRENIQNGGGGSAWNMALTGKADVARAKTLQVEILKESRMTDYIKEKLVAWPWELLRKSLRICDTVALCGGSKDMLLLQGNEPRQALNRVRSQIHNNLGAFHELIRSQRLVTPLKYTTVVNTG